MRYLAVLATLLAGFMLFALTVSSTRTNAQNPGNDESKIKEGFAIAPVPLNLAGKDRALVGLGSYIVNAQGPVIPATPVPPLPPVTTLTMAKEMGRPTPRTTWRADCCSQSSTSIQKISLRTVRVFRAV